MGTGLLGTGHMGTGLWTQGALFVISMIATPAGLHARGYAHIHEDKHSQNDRKIFFVFMNYYERRCDSVFVGIEDLQVCINFWEENLAVFFSIICICFII
jgi:hypothetical protein